MNKNLLVLLTFVAIAGLTTACVYDSECTINGVVNRCTNGQCVVTAECTKDVDCITRGIYFQCTNAKCVASDHKICLTNDDCKKNLLNTKCVNNHCTT